MWLLLSVPFGVSGCLFITLMVFDLLDPDRKADEKREVLPEAVSLPQQDIVIEDVVVQTLPSALPEPASVLPEPVPVDAQV